MRLRIGPHSVRVLSDARTDVLLAEANVLGDSDTTRSLIRVRSDLPRSVWHDTLVHEVLHHVWANTHLAAARTDDDEEQTIRALTPYLVGLGFLREFVEANR